MKKIKLAIVDDHNIFLKGVHMLLENHEKIEVVKTFLKPQLFLHYIKEHEVDVVLMDLNMPEINGITCAKETKIINSDISIIALSMHFEEQYITAAYQSGFNGYLLKNSSIQELEEAILDVYYGKKHFSKELGNLKNIKKESTTAELINSITDREKEIVKLLCENYSTKEISDKIFIAESTVKTHRRNILKKLQISSTPHLITFVNKNKLLLFD